MPVKRFIFCASGAHVLKSTLRASSRKLAFCQRPSAFPKLILVAMLTLSACTEFKFEPSTLRAQGVPHNGSPEFNQGWKDGCDSGMAAFGNYTYKLVYKLKKDVNLAESTDYEFAWNSAYNTCRWYTSTWLQPPGEDAGGLF